METAFVDVLVRDMYRKISLLMRGLEKTKLKQGCSITHSRLFAIVCKTRKCSLLTEFIWELLKFVKRSTRFSLHFSCILVRYASQNSLDESSQKQLPRPNGKDKSVGAYRNNVHTQRSFDAMNNMRE